MKIFEANLTETVLQALQKEIANIHDYVIANTNLFNHYGIESFFSEQQEFKDLQLALYNHNSVIEELYRAEYGDFQTNINLSLNVCAYLQTKSIRPRIIIEPTCGKGNFLLASLKSFDSIEVLIGIEIFKPYIWEAKFNIIEFFLNNPETNRPRILLYHTSVFDFDFKEVAKKYPEKEFLILGNPPWVTNSKLGSLNSVNLPKKTNFKNHNGLDAITGKGNFDIAEFITTDLIKIFQSFKGNLVLLVKNSIVKNIVYDQKNSHYTIGNLERLGIDSKKEFNVSVEASLFYCSLSNKIEYNCKEFNFYNPLILIKSFGWLEDKFVSNISTYINYEDIDGVSPFIWRQGLKHDCSSIMEFEDSEEHFVNGLNELVNIEPDLVYGLLKSSDLKNKVITKSRKYTIVTQRKVGQDTAYIKTEYPKTYQYLYDHSSNFEARKSSIYRNKPMFSIFGIGDYSFMPYKVAISGLYKSFSFTLVLPQDGKPVMLDDTCYLVGFNKLEFAFYTLILVNSETSVKFFQSITFYDAKRIFTKDILMRLDLHTLAKNIALDEVDREISILNKKYLTNITTDNWEDFLNIMKPLNSQMEIFA